MAAFRLGCRHILGGNMARQQKKLDPTNGPLEAFAFDLRKVRADAGDPTYRALAKTAGYGATTLSEAASGTRRPTLDVVLAYVGACGGDVEAWRQRWHELQATLEPATPTPPAGAARPDTASATTGSTPAGASALPTPAVAAVSSPRQRTGLRPARGWLRGAVSVAAACVLVAVAVAVYRIARPGSTSGAEGCPAVPAAPAFKAKTYGGGARVRAGAARDAKIVRTIPSDCTVGLTGFCLGEKLHDNTGGTPDIRWFKLPDGNVLFSGMVHGNPPPWLPPTRCADDRTGPSAIGLTVVAAPARPATVTLSATGDRLDIVGFAALYDVDSEQPTPHRWRQVAMVEDTTDRPGFSADWRLDRLPASATRQPIVVVAAACLGGDGPTGIVDARTVDPHDVQAAAQGAVLAPEDIH